MVSCVMPPDEEDPANRWRKKGSLLLGAIAACIGISRGISADEAMSFNLPGGATVEMVWIQPGSFVMGSPVSDWGRLGNEGPQHEVTITEGFFLGKYEVTQGQWDAVMGTRPWANKDHAIEDPDRPAVYVSWDDAQEFASKANPAEGVAVYRLPTEAQWEYACRAGTSAPRPYGSDLSSEKYAWCSGNAWFSGLGYALRVGTRLPNQWGLYDMHGNVWEWVQDWYGPYSDGAQVDPTGPSAGRYHTIRGGDFDDDCTVMRSTLRVNSPSVRYYGIGFRLARRKLAVQPVPTGLSPREWGQIKAGVCK